jgi:hypothetical protein
MLVGETGLSGRRRPYADECIKRAIDPPSNSGNLQSICNQLTRTTSAFRVLSVPSVLCKSLRLRFQAGSNPSLSASPFNLRRYRASSAAVRGTRVCPSDLHPLREVPTGMSAAAMPRTANAAAKHTVQCATASALAKKKATDEHRRGQRLLF